jgi:hypothetical protein
MDWFELKQTDTQRVARQAALAPVIRELTNVSGLN